jgi:hypothetical protein
MRPFSVLFFLFGQKIVTLGWHNALARGTELPTRLRCQTGRQDEPGGYVASSSSSSGASQSIYQSYQRNIASALVQFGLLVAPMATTMVTAPIQADAAISSSAEWGDRNRLSAESWRTVDDLFYERTFNGQNWFKIRQEMVKPKVPFKSDEEVRFYCEPSY